MIRKALVAAALMALASTPAWALPAGTPSNSGTARAPETTPVGPPSSPPNDESNSGSSNRSGEGDANAGGGEHRSGASNRSEGTKKEGRGEPGSHGKSHKCKPHAVAYIASGTLVSASLTEEEGGHHTYKGEITIEVKRTNHHAAGDKGTTKTYMIEDAHVSGPVPVSALEKGDWVKVIGRITMLSKKCEAGEFKPTITVRRLIVHGPRTSTTTTTTSSTTSTSSITTSSTETTTSTSTSST